MAHPTKYLLPCECGRSILVDVGQAGQMVTCGCGKSQEAPTMRGIRALEPAAAENEKLAAAEPRGWSALQGSLFATGVMAMVLAGALAAYFGWITSQIVVPPAPDETTAFNEYLETAPIDKLYAEYMEVRAKGLTEKNAPYHVVAAQAKDIYRKRTIGSLIGVAIGAIVTVAAFFARSSDDPQ